MSPSSGTSKSARAGRGRPLAPAILLAAAAGAAAFAAPAGEAPSVEARLDKDRAAVGEPITMTVTVRLAPPLHWEARSVGDRIGDFDVEQVQGPGPAPHAEGAADPNAASPGPAAACWVFRLTAFRLGKLQIPPITLRGLREGSPEPVSAVTQPLDVEIVATVTDPEGKPADIREGFGLPPDRSGWIWAGAGLVAAAGALLLGSRLWRRLRRRAIDTPRGAPPAPTRPAYDRCLEALEALLRSGLLEAGKIKEFHVALSEIVKRYLGEVYGFDAIDRTTWEAMRDLAATEASASLRSETGVFLSECDLVKFAKHRPGPAEVQETVARARKILDLARPAVLPEAAVGRAS